jgi:hypothetical protein
VTGWTFFGLGCWLAYDLLHTRRKDRRG